MSIIALSIERFKKFIPEEDSVAISIRDPDCLEDLDFSRYKDHLEMFFWDVEETCVDMEPIDDEQARQIAEFIEKHKNVKHLVIHCMGGVSRSVGTAFAADCIRNYWGDKYMFSIGGTVEFTKLPHQHPNLTVYDKILKQHEVMFNESSGSSNA